MDKEQIELRMKLKNAQINNALGFFIMFFGLIVSFAFVFSKTDTEIQMETNIISGIILVAIGGGMMLIARKTIKKAKALIK